MAAGGSLGTLLMGAGLLLLGYAALWQVGWAPGSRISVPPPVALARAAPGARAALAEPAPPLPAIARSIDEANGADSGSSVIAASVPVQPAPADLPVRALPVPADRADRIEAAATPPPGYAVKLRIPSIKLVTDVQQAGIKLNALGQPEWETLPFVAAHYGDLTALVGGRGNAVIAGHVVTLSEGNVFRFLYQVDLGEEVIVEDARGAERRFVVTEIRLVSPDDVSVMEQTPDRRLTLITCGGTFDPIRREFSDRLIVVAQPA